MGQLGRDAFENNDILNEIVGNNPAKIEEGQELSKKELYRQIMSKPLLTGHDILLLPIEPNEYLVENFIWKNSISILVGAEKTCKSIFTTQKAMSMTYGDNFLGVFDVVRPLKILYCQAEGDMGETKERMESAGKPTGVKWDKDNWRHYFPAALSLDIDGDMDELGKYPEGTYNDLVDRIEKDGFSPDVIIIDPLYMAMDGDLSDNKAARHFCRNIRRLKEKYDCAIIIIHHQRRPTTNNFGQTIKEKKGDNAIFGSSMWKNFASHVLHISVCNEKGKTIYTDDDNDSSVKYRKIVCDTQRNNDVIRKLILMLTNDPLKFSIVGNKSSSATESIVYNVIESNEVCSCSKIHEQTGIPEQTVRNALGKLKEDKKIRVCGKDGRKVIWGINKGGK